MALHVLDEANRCLGCKKPMCQQGCPIHTNIPEVIRLLKDNHLDDAGRMLFENNPLTTVCSLVCNHENQCEGHCIRNRMPSHDPVHFSIIEDYISILPAWIQRWCGYLSLPTAHRPLSCPRTG